MEKINSSRIKEFLDDLNGQDCYEFLNVVSTIIKRFQEKLSLKEEEEHVLDKALGDIHECSLLLANWGLAELAIKLAIAHEKIQEYIVEKELN